MVLNSFWYFVFLFAVFLVVHVARDGSRPYLLLAASFAFYASFGSPLVLTVLSLVTAVSYATGLLLRATGEDERPGALWIGVLANVGILVAFRYLAACGSALGWFGGSDCATEGVVVTVGVSYFVLQAISYVVDVHLKVIEPERHLGHFILYLAFFPKLLQGPIERANDLLPQLKRVEPFDYVRARNGLRLFLFGLFQKVVLADRLALYVNPVYNDVHSYTGLVFVAATYLYALQIYFDFSGYTDMARGSALLLGISLSPNFNSPYLATSIPDFWRRWHMSFSRWLLDYLFKPLQIALRDSGRLGTSVAFLVTFLLSGLWHGAAWGFVVWGMLHGVYLVASFLYRPFQKRLVRQLSTATRRVLDVLSVVLTFNLVSFAWIFFRANSIQDAGYIVTNLLSGVNGLGSYLLVDGKVRLILLASTLLAYLLVASLSRRPAWVSRFDAAPRWARWVGYCLLVYSVVFLWPAKSDGFIYLHF